MTLIEARERAQGLVERFGDPVAIIQIGEAYNDMESGNYSVRGFIKGQRVKVGTTFVTLGRITNFYDTAVEIYE